jgi:hypothetical protein
LGLAAALVLVAALGFAAVLGFAAAALAGAFGLAAGFAFGFGRGFGVGFSCAFSESLFPAPVKTRLPRSIAPANAACFMIAFKIPISTPFIGK